MKRTIKLFIAGFLFTAVVFGQMNSDSVSSSRTVADESSGKQKAESKSDDFSNPFSTEEGITTEGATEGAKPSAK